MRKLIITGKTGFKVKNPELPIIIRDERGLLFYTTEPLIPKVKEFNLPKGVYFVETGSFEKMLFPRAYKNIRLPHKERYFFPDPSNFDIKFANNPNKCSVNWKSKTITFDNAFKEMPLPYIDFILFHEFGHRYFSTEKYCDLYAAKCMLNIGYNPSQIGYGQIDSLSDKQTERKEFIINHLSNA